MKTKTPVCFRKEFYVQGIAKTADTANRIMTVGGTVTIKSAVLIQMIGMSAVNKILHISKECNEAIVSAMASLPPEVGGILGTKTEGIITAFSFDKGRDNSTEFYIPDVTILNQVIRSWKQNDIKFAGMIHSHLRGRKQLSASDVEYAKKIMRSMSIDKLYMLIIDTDTKEYDITAFEFVGNNEEHSEVKLEII